MRFNLMFPLTFLIVIFLTNCKTTGASINTLKGDNVDFSSYQTFYLLPEPPTDENPLAVKSFPRSVVERAVTRELKLKNYKEVKDKDEADMLVAIQFSLKDEERTYTTTDSNYGNGGYGGYGHGGYGHGYGYRNYYGYRTFSNTSTSTHTEQFRKGNMIIDLIDKKENALIWEAFAQGSGETEMDAIEEKVNRVVTDIFTRYPLVLDKK